MCIKSYRTTYNNRIYRFSKKQLNLVKEKSEVYKTVIDLNNSIATLKDIGCIQVIKRDVMRTKELNNLTPKKLAKELVPKYPALYAKSMKEMLDNEIAYNKYFETVSKLKFSSLEIASSIPKISADLFHAIELYIKNHNTRKRPEEPYIKLVIHSLKYGDTDEIKIPLVMLLSYQRLEKH